MRRRERERHPRFLGRQDINKHASMSVTHIGDAWKGCMLGEAKSSQSFMRIWSASGHIDLLCVTAGALL